MGRRHHLVIGAFLSEPDRYPARQPLIEPKVVQLHAWRRLDVADELVVAD
jgi:hypothetical protein